MFPQASAGAPTGLAASTLILEAHDNSILVPVAAASAGTSLRLPVPPLATALDPVKEAPPDVSVIDTEFPVHSGYIEPNH